MSKRKLLDDDRCGVDVAPKYDKKKHSLDSDEEDSGAEEEKKNVMHADDIEGEEEGVAAIEGEVTITPFNMKEELEEGHFDTAGHYHWKKEKEIKDGWLDNIDWVKVRGRPENKYKVHKDDDDLKGLGESSSESETEEEKSFNLISSYRAMIEFMLPKETVLKTLKRLGGNKKLSSAERWQQKKAGIVDTNSENVTKLTSVANEILTRTGNMDIYQETYEKIKSIIDKADRKTFATGNDDMLDMYADDFDSKEKKKMDTSEASTSDQKSDPEEEDNAELMWEFKWKQNDDKVHGPHSTKQMHQWVLDGYFKTGVWARKCGQDGPFYASNRIDFDLYI